MSNEIYEVTLTNAAPVHVEAKSKAAAIKAAYTVVSARKLSGSEVLALGNDPIASVNIIQAPSGEDEPAAE